VLAVGLRCGGTAIAPRVPDAGVVADATLTDGAPALSEAAALSPDASACNITPSEYDTSCSTDSECVSAAFGNFCEAVCNCPTDYINQSALAKYMADVSKTPVGMGAIQPSNCNCGNLGAGCCRSGHCAPCGPPTVSSDGAAIEGMDVYVIPDGSTLCSMTNGPVDAEAAGVERCLPPATCTSLSGGWACCSMVGPGTTVCH
jgi:hypothetical protein